MVFTGITGVLILISVYMSLIWAPTALNLPTVNEQLAGAFSIFMSAGWVGYVAFGVTARGQRALSNQALRAGLTTLPCRQRKSVSFSPPPIWSAAPSETASLEHRVDVGRPAADVGSHRPDGVYRPHLMLRNAIDDPERKARLASIYGIVGFISVPLSFVSVRIWRTIHPAVIGTASASSQGGFDMSGNMVITLLFSIFTFSLLYSCCCTTGSVWKISVSNLRNIRWP